MSVIVFLVVGTIILGIASPTESAALGCLGVAGLLLAYRRFSWDVVLEVARRRDEGHRR